MFVFNFCTAMHLQVLAGVCRDRQKCQHTKQQQNNNNNNNNKQLLFLNCLKFGRTVSLVRLVSEGIGDSDKHWITIRHFAACLSLVSNSSFYLFIFFLGLSATTKRKRRQGTIMVKCHKNINNKRFFSAIWHFLVPAPWG